mmetsp:Transcript_70151/g.198862  ORF Transcript_70151/g.198862 Transcript_70151/m.198862 type:complete len:717 (+) Transcript_70151:81-2231(+)
MAPATKRARPAASASKGSKKQAAEGAPQKSLQMCFGQKEKKDAAVPDATEAQAPAEAPPADSGAPKGLQRFFGQAKRTEAATGGEERPQEQPPAAAAAAIAPPAPAVARGEAPSPPTTPQKASAPAPGDAPPAVAEGEAGQGEPAKLLSSEQLQRIEENRRRARERQEQKRKREDEGDQAETQPKQQVPSSPARQPAPNSTKAGTQPKQQAPSSPAQPKSPATLSPARPAGGRATPNVTEATPEKPTAPERRSPAPSVSAQEALGPRQACSGRFACMDYGVWMQFNDLYAARLGQLRKAALQEARSFWGGMVDPDVFMSEVGGFKRCGEGREAVLIGVLFKELKGRPSVIDQYKDLKLIGNLGEDTDADVAKRLNSDDDTLWLEDSSMRLRLVASPEHIARLATGIVAAVRGSPTPEGSFRISALCFARMGEQPSLPKTLAASATPGSFLALVSGLGFGTEGPGAEELAAARERAAEMLLGGSEALPLGAVQKLLVCGGTFTADALTGSADAKAALHEADAFLARLAAKISVDVMPGRSDPTNLSLPQMPLHPYLFKSVRDCRDFRSVSNPFDCTVDGVAVLGHSGQPVEDMLRCTSLGKPIEALTTCLQTSHLAPTAPDTLATQPFGKTDPFVMDTLPHVLFSGGHDHAEHQWHAAPRGEGGTLCVCVPAFRKKPAVVLVNLRDLQDVRVHDLGPGHKEVDAPMDDKESAIPAEA